MEPFLSSIPTKHLVKTLLPEPDSPTMARVSPSYRSREVRRIAVSLLPRREKVTSTSRADRIGSCERIRRAFASKSTLFISSIRALMAALIFSLVLSLIFSTSLYT